MSNRRSWGWPIMTLVWLALVASSPQQAWLGAQTTDGAARSVTPAAEPAAEERVVVIPVGRNAAARDAAGRGEETLAEGSFRRTDALLASITIFVLAVFLGFELITKVPPTLHTPLMSGSNAISGIILVGAVLVAGAEHSTFAAMLGMLAVLLATINVVGGFLVTDRMLGMFQKKR